MKKRLTKKRCDHYLLLINKKIFKKINYFLMHFSNLHTIYNRGFGKGLERGSQRVNKGLNGWKGIRKSSQGCDWNIGIE